MDLNIFGQEWDTRKHKARGNEADQASLFACSNSSTIMAGQREEIAEMLQSMDRYNPGNLDIFW